MRWQCVFFSMITYTCALLVHLNSTLKGLFAHGLQDTLCVKVRSC